MEVKVSTIIDDVRTCIDEIGLNDANFEGSSDNTDMNKIIESKIVDALRFVYTNADDSLLESNITAATSEVETEGSDIKLSYNDKGVGIADLPANFLRLVYAKIKSWVRSLSHVDLVKDTDRAYSMLGNKYSTGTPVRPKAALVQMPKGKRIELYTGRVSSNILAVFEGDIDCVLVKGTPRKGNWHIVKTGEGWYVRTVVVDDEESAEEDKRICVVRYKPESTSTTKPYELTLYKVSEFDESLLYEEDYIELGILTDPEKISITTGGTTVNGYDIPEKVYRAAIYYISGLTLTTYREAQAAQVMFEQANDLIGFTQQAAAAPVVQNTAE